MISYLSLSLSLPVFTRMARDWWFLLSVFAFRQIAVQQAIQSVAVLSSHGHHYWRHPLFSLWEKVHTCLKWGSWPCHWWFSRSLSADCCGSAARRYQPLHGRIHECPGREGKLALSLLLSICIPPSFSAHAIPHHFPLPLFVSFRSSVLFVQIYSTYHVHWSQMMFSMNLYAVLLLGFCNFGQYRARHDGRDDHRADFNSFEKSDASLLLFFDARVFICCLLYVSV